MEKCENRIKRKTRILFLFSRGPSTYPSLQKIKEKSVKITLNEKRVFYTKSFTSVAKGRGGETFV